MWISKKQYNFLFENAEKNIDAECEILKVKHNQNKAVARAMEEYSAVLEERDKLLLKVAELESILNINEERQHTNKACEMCRHYGWNMPQCKHCSSKNNFKYFSREFDIDD